MDILVSRQAAIDAIYKCTDYYVGNLPVMIDKADAYKALADLPAAEPTLYGYNINHLAFIAGIMAKKGITAEEAIEIFKDAERLFKLISDDMQENFRIAIEKAVTR